jgi:NADH-quinone oxidoreductase subunit G
MSLEVIMVKIRIDGKDHEVKPGKNLLETCLSLGIDIPHFCFHPALGSVGACRLCAVKKFRDKDDTRGRVIMSCMEPVTEGLIISVDDPDAVAFRKSVLESLMTNHPHDCPVCDEGGECHLQDMTVMTGHNYRRFDFPKRTYENQQLGPFINHEMNRCIQCYRCVRFYKDYAGGKDLNVFSSRNHVYFGRHEDGTLENEFSGNLAEVCPTGVFTDKTLKSHFTRKWDLTNAPSLCVHCSVGCNTIVSERYGSVRRIMNRYNGAVNGYFICDRGRFGYEFLNDGKRIKKFSLKKRNENPSGITDSGQVLSILNKSVSDDKKLAGIGSPRASLEANYALMSLVGKENFYHGVSKQEFILTEAVLNFFSHSAVRIPSLKQIEKSDAILILGEDLVNTAPMTALAVRQAVRNLSRQEADAMGIPLWNDAPVRELAQNDRSPVFIATPSSDSLDEIAAGIFRGTPFSIASLGFAIAKNIDAVAPVSLEPENKIHELALKIAETLKKAKNPLIISGTSCIDRDIINAAFNVATALHSVGKEVMISMVLPECNSMGLALLPGSSFEDIALQEDKNHIDTLIILENDLFRRADGESLNVLINSCGQVVVLDHLDNRTTAVADILLPAAPYAESEGTLINNEGRAQRYYKSSEPAGEVKESWKWISDLIRIRNDGKVSDWENADKILNAAADEFPSLVKLKNYNPDADFRMLNAKVPRQTMRYSGRTAINANLQVSEPKSAQDTDSPLAYSMEGVGERPPSSLVPFYWTPGWNSVQALYNYLDEPNGSMKGGDPGIRLFEPSGTASKNYYDQISKSDKVKDDKWLIVPVYQIFGSDELSSVSKSVSQRIKKPFVLLNPVDAEAIHLKEGDSAGLDILKDTPELTVKIDNSIEKGVAGLAVNLPGMPYMAFPAVGKFYKL